MLGQSFRDYNWIPVYQKGFYVITPLHSSFVAGPLAFHNFRPRVYLMGSIVIALVRLSVCLSVFKYLRDRSLVFSETLHEVRGQLSKKSDTAEILKKKS